MRLFPREEINGAGRCPTYLYRWTLLRLGKWFAVYLHKFVGDDWSTDLHDHPKRFISIGLRGRYVEITECKRRPGILQYHDWRAPWFRSLAATHKHRLRMVPGETCWTICIVLRPVREWGFWADGAFIPWRTYIRSKRADDAKACP